MTRLELKRLDKMLVKLQSLLDKQHPLHPSFEAAVRVRAEVDQQIVRLESRELPPDAPMPGERIPFPVQGNTKVFMCRLVATNPETGRDVVIGEPEDRWRLEADLQVHREIADHSGLVNVRIEDLD